MFIKYSGSDFPILISKINDLISTKSDDYSTANLSDALPMKDLLLNLKIVVNKQNGTAKIIASIKDGSDYKVETFNDIKIEDLPQQVINSVDLNDKSSIYSATNPNAVKYNKQISIVDNKESFLESIDYLPEKERYAAYKNPPVTQEDIYKNFKEVYGEEIINKYSEEIKNILN